MPPSSMNDLFAFLTQLMTQHADIFETMGAHMYRGLAIILIAWFGAQSALSAAGGGHASLVHFDRFASLLITIAFGFGMITYYSHPIPGFGISFYHLIIDQGLDLANRLNHAIVQELWDRLSNMYWGMETPGLTLAFNYLEFERYLATTLGIIAAQPPVFSLTPFAYLPSP